MCRLIRTDFPSTALALLHDLIKIHKQHKVAIASQDKWLELSMLSVMQLLHLNYPGAILEVWSGDESEDSSEYP